MSDTDERPLGLLAGVWGDGSVRVLDIYIPPSAITVPEYVYCTATAFAAKPPHTISTSVTWISAASIAAAHANGTISVFHIPTSLATASSEATPVLTTVAQTTYILSITSCYPSRPHMLLATGMSGHLSLTDLTEASSASAMSPTTTILSARSRISRPICVWHDWAQLALTVDDVGTLQGCPLRRFYGMTGLTKFTSNATTVAVSPVHPFVMTGSVGGEVVCTNPLRRVFDSKAPIWNVKWFRHEWRRSRLPDTRIEVKDQDTDSDVENEVVNAANMIKDRNGDIELPDLPDISPEPSPEPRGQCRPCERAEAVRSRHDSYSRRLPSRKHQIGR